MTPDSTAGNLCGSRMESVIGITYKAHQNFDISKEASIRTKPMPSNEKTAVLWTVSRENSMSLQTQKHIPNQQWEVLWVEEFNFRDATFSNDPEFAPEDVDEAGKDEYVRDKRRCAQLCEIPDQRHGKEDDELHENKILDWDERRAARGSVDETLQVLSDEYRICRDKADLRDGDGSEN